jgi:hypothetical protein
MHANGSTGPHIGYAAVMEDGTLYRSNQRRPVLALADINGQISQANAGRYAVGKPAHEGPTHIGQLHPYFQNSNPSIDALLAGMCPPRVTGMSESPRGPKPRAKLPTVPATNDHDSGLGWTERTA